MEVHQLRYLYAVVQTGSFSRAAEQCHVSQPSLSQQILKLEEELGETLFNRGARKITPTPAGRMLAERAGRVLRELAEARREVESAKGLAGGRVVIGALPTIAPYLLPTILKHYRSQFPQVSVLAVEETTANLLALVDKGEVDVALVSPPIDGERYRMEKVRTEELFLALPEGHSLSTRKRIRFEDLEHDEFILLKEGHCLSDQVISFCERHSVQPRVTFRSAQIETIRGLITAGLGLSLIPAMARDFGGPVQPLFRSLSPKPTRTVSLLWRATHALSPAAQALTDLVLSTCREQPGTNRGRRITFEI